MENKNATETQTATATETPKKKTRGNFNFKKCGIPKNAVCVFRKNPEITMKVLNPETNKVKLSTGEEVLGVAVSEEIAYRNSNLTPPKRLMGYGWSVKNWKEENGEKVEKPIEKLWLKVPVES